MTSCTNGPLRSGRRIVAHPSGIELHVLKRWTSRQLGVVSLTLVQISVPPSAFIVFSPWNHCDPPWYQLSADPLFRLVGLSPPAP